jgi:hypothetical protein
MNPYTICMNWFNLEETVVVKSWCKSCEVGSYEPNCFICFKPYTSIKEPLFVCTPTAEMVANRPTATNYQGLVNGRIPN